MLPSKEAWSLLSVSWGWDSKACKGQNFIFLYLYWFDLCVHLLCLRTQNTFHTKCYLGRPRWCMILIKTSGKKFHSRKSFGELAAKMNGCLKNRAATGHLIKSKKSRKTNSYYWFSHHSRWVLSRSIAQVHEVLFVSHTKDTQHKTRLWKSS